MCNVNQPRALPNALVRTRLLVYNRRLTSLSYAPHWARQQPQYLGPALPAHNRAERDTAYMHDKRV
jgi:hypothetical protein